MQQEEQQHTSSRYIKDADNVDTLLIRLDPTPSLDQIRAYLMQWEYNPETKNYKDVGVKPMFKSEGIKDLMGELYTIMAVDTALSNLTENEIRRILRNVGEKLHEFIWFKFDVYGINESDWNRIYFTILHKVEIFLRRAKDGKTAQQISEGLLRRETVTQDMSSNYKDGDVKATGWSWNPFARRA